MNAEHERARDRLKEGILSLTLESQQRIIERFDRQITAHPALDPETVVSRTIDEEVYVPLAD